jgi:phage tail sheath protein FI
MATYSRPGVYVQESILQQSTAVNDRSDATAAFIGSLPIGPDQPTLVRSWAQFVKTFGGLNYSYPTTVAVNAFFANGGRDTYIQRVTGSSAAAASVVIPNSTTAATTLTATASSKGTWANSSGAFPLGITVTAGVSTGRFNISVYGPPLSLTPNDATSNVLETYTDLSMNKSDSRYAVAVVNAFSAYIVLTDAVTSPSSNGLPPAVGSTVYNPASGNDGSAITATNITGILTNFDNIRTPLIMNAPDAVGTVAGYASSGITSDSSAYTIHVGLITYAETRGDCFVVMDTPYGKSATDALTFATSSIAGATGANGAMYYPWLQVPDQSKSIPGITTYIPPAGAVIGQYQANDASRGVFKAPAGYSARLNSPVGLEKRLTNAELDSLNVGSTTGVPVNAIRVVPGAGIVIMGGRTLANTIPARYVNIRRSLIYIKKEVTDRTGFAIFENNDEILWANIRTKLQAFLRGYWAQGGLKGTTPDQAFFVRCDETNNTASDIANGRVNIEVGLALQYPAEFIVITIGQLSSTATA